MVFCCVAKLCRESRPFLVQFYVANHAVLVAHFNPKKSVGDTKFVLRGLAVEALSLPNYHPDTHIGRDPRLVAYLMLIRSQHWSPV